MIYLIGGAPRCGKTTIAQTLSRKLRISWIASDTLESIAMAYTSRKDFQKLFPKSVMRRKTKFSNDLMYDKYTPKQIVKAYIKQSEVVWKAIEMLVESELKEGRSFIIEGYHVHPRLVSNLKKKYGRRNFKSVFLTKLDIDNIEKNSLKYTYKNDWFVKKTKNKGTYKKISAMIVELSRYFGKEAKRFNLRVFVTDIGFKKKINQTIQYLVRKN